MEWNWYINSFEKLISCIPRNTYTKIGTIQRRLAWPLRKDDTQIREAFHIFCKPISFGFFSGPTLQKSKIDKI